MLPAFVNSPRSTPDVDIWLFFNRCFDSFQINQEDAQMITPIYTPPVSPCKFQVVMGLNLGDFLVIS